MHRNSNGSRAAAARGFMALFAVMLVMGLGAMAPPGEAAPFAYVTNGGDNTVSVIDMATNTVVGIPILVGREPFGVDVTPDGKHAYVTAVFSARLIPFRGRLISKCCVLGAIEACA
jgi:YVTN family beta-propeller protein